MSPEQPNFVLRRMSDTSEEALLEEIRRVDGIINKSTLTRSEFLKQAKVSPTTLRRRFGTWQAALERAGLGKKFFASTFSEESGVGRRNHSDDEILGELRELAARLGRNEITTDDIRGQLGMSTQTLINRFGSTKSALTAAGLKQSKRGRRYTDEERFENLLNVWTVLGRQPKYQDMQLAPSTVGGKAYVTRYDTWLKALEAFVERVNADEPGAPLSDEDRSLLEKKTPNSNKVEAPTRPEDRREIRLGQRFRILSRDNLKCVLCGNSPAVNPTCQLHVDHILPFSRGGKTVDSNLRSLCAACNVGRGDRYDG